MNPLLQRRRLCAVLSLELPECQSRVDESGGVNAPHGPLRTLAPSFPFKNSSPPGP